MITQSEKDRALKMVERIVAWRESHDPSADLETWSLIAGCGALLHTFGREADVQWPSPDVQGSVRDATPEERNALRRGAH